MALFKRPAPLTSAAPIAPPWDDKCFFDEYPSITSFLSDGTYDGGQARRLGSITLFVMDGALKCAVNDKDRNVVAFVTAQSVTELLTLIEVGIGKDSLEWKAGSRMPAGKNPPY